MTDQDQRAEQPPPDGPHLQDPPPQPPPPPEVDSVYSTVRRACPHLGAVRVRKRLLTPVSHALEQEISARARRPVLFGGFQTAPVLAASLRRWQRLAVGARACVAFADLAGSPLEDSPLEADGMNLAEVDPSAPLRMEWMVVCDDDAFSCVLSAWEVPGLSFEDDGDRIFELLWSLEPQAARVAARTCARLAAEAGVPGADGLVADLAADASAVPDLRTLWQVVTRVLAHVGGAPGEGYGLRHPEIS